jgi:carboxypeptidase PM20D1
MRATVNALCGIFLVSALVSGPGALAASGAAERLAEAVRFRTISHQQAEAMEYAEFERFNGFLRREYPRVFSQLQVEEVNGYSLLIRWPGSRPDLQPILFTAHTDVVPIEPGTEDDWAHPPFAGVIADGRVYGRGTLDDKVGVLGLLEAAESLLGEGFVPERTVVFAFGHDEEIGGKEGAGKMAELMAQRGWRFLWQVDEGGMVITDNPLLPEKAFAMVNVAEKGYLTLTLVATGEGGHSSRPPKQSTIGRLSAALAKVETNPYAPELVVPVRAMLEAVAPHMGQPERFIFNNLWLTGGIVANQMAADPATSSFVRTTTALTMINAGVKENVIPQRAEAKVNFRLLPGVTPQEVVERITTIVDDPNIEISYSRWDNVPAISDHEGPGFRVIADAVVKSYPDAVVAPSLLVATTDTRHYIDITENQYRFHGNSMSMAQGASIHGTNEYIGIDGYERSIEVARGMLREGSRQ